MSAIATARKAEAEARESYREALAAADDDPCERVGDDGWLASDVASWKRHLLVVAIDATLRTERDDRNTEQTNERG